MKKIINDSYYAGIGSRETPKDIINLMERIAAKLWIKHKNILRSGGADGADEAFRLGGESVNANMEIYIPWDGFNNFVNGHSHAILQDNQELIEKARTLAQKTHPAFDKLTQGGKRLMIRNVFQIYGDFITHSDFVLCWTPDAANGKDIPTSFKTGGTGQAIRLAAQLDIPVINLANPKYLKKWLDWVN